MKRIALLSSLFFLLLMVSVARRPQSPVSAKETWTSVRSKNFYLLGNAGEKDIRKVAIKLEQFREVFSNLFPRAKLNSPIPIRVIVFKDRQDYRPFMPVYQGKVNEVSGYFMPGSDINYITLTAELSQENPFSTIFHEYVHSLTNDNTFSTPLWFSEGLAEFYSTFEVTDGDQKVWLGKPISNHVYLLRGNQFLPLPRLFDINHQSADYNVKDKKGLFYSQSWALLHFLLLGNNAQRQGQTIKYIELLAQGVGVDKAFSQAFQIDYATMEKELRNYIGRNSYPISIFTFARKLQFDTEIETARITEAEWNYYLGDLLLHQRRADGEQYLRKALDLDPNLAAAHASLGMLRMQQRNFGEARQSLERAIATGSDNHLVHFNYAFMLSREAMGAGNMVTGFPPETAGKMRDHLKTAIRLAPDFPESYNLLAFVNLVMGEELEESVNLLQRAIQLSPGRDEYFYMLAQVRMRQQKYDESRRLLGSLVKNGKEEDMRQRAQSLLETVNNIAEQMERNRIRTNPPPPSFPSQSELTDGAIPPDPGSTRPTLRRRIEGERMRGLLTEIVCNNEGLTIVVENRGQLFTFNASQPDRVQFISYGEETQSAISCGKLNTAKPVMIIYRGSTDAGSPHYGELLAVEFVKPEPK